MQDSFTFKAQVNGPNLLFFSLVQVTLAVSVPTARLSMEHPYIPSDAEDENKVSEIPTQAGTQISISVNR